MQRSYLPPFSDTCSSKRVQLILVREEKGLGLDLVNNMAEWAELCHFPFLNRRCKIQKAVPNKAIAMIAQASYL